VTIVLKSGSLVLLEPSGPVQACNGIALPFALVIVCHVAAYPILNASSDESVYQVGIRKYLTTNSTEIYSINLQILRF
jgi:hypothetical protein